MPSLSQYSKDVRGATTDSLVPLRLASEDRSSTCATTLLLKSATLSFRLVCIKRHTNAFACYCVARVLRLPDDAGRRSSATCGCTSPRLRHLGYRRCFRLGKHYTYHVGSVHLEYPHSNVRLNLSCCMRESHD